MSEIIFGSVKSSLWIHLFKDRWFSVGVQIGRYHLGFSLYPTENHYGNKLMSSLTKWVDCGEGVGLETIIDFGLPIKKFFYPLWKFVSMRKEV